MNTGFCSSVLSLHCDYKTLKHWNCMHLTFFVSCLLAKNVSLRCFCGSCVVVCGGALSVLFSTWEKSLSVKLHSASATAPATDAFFPPLRLWRFVWKPQAGVTLPMGDLFTLRTAALICLSFCGFDYIYSSASLASSPPLPSSYSLPLSGEPRNPSLPVTRLQDLLVELWPWSQASPKL